MSIVGTWQLKGMGAALGPPHPNQTRGDMAKLLQRVDSAFFFSDSVQILAEIYVKKIIKINLWVVF